MRDSVTPFSKTLTGYLYIKGVFYLHLIEAKNMKYINEYLSSFYSLWQKDQNLQT